VSPIALEAVKRIDCLFAIEREINGLSADERRQVRQERSRLLVDDLRAWLADVLARVRGPSGARDEFHLAAAAQNLRKLAKLLPNGPQVRTA
jgi:hypothetical protein